MLSSNVVNASLAKNDEYFESILFKIKAQLIEKHNNDTFTHWIDKMYLADYNNNIITIAVPTRFIKDWISSNYLDSILRLWKQYEQSIQKIDIIVAQVPETPTTNNIHPKLENIKQKDLNSDKQVKFGTDLSNGIFQFSLDPRFTFENFVVGTPNELAYAAARAVAETSDCIQGSNPLFLYGGVGLGKTHLMHAIAWHTKTHFPSRKVAYMSAEKFMYQFVKALRNKDIIAFKEACRSIELLMIDDIQFICGKDSTQEEFFHMINSLLIEHKRQIIISCDRSPSDLDDIEDRIKSRLGWGLVVDVHSTTYELRIGILQSKTEKMDVYVPEDVIEFLAAKITSNVRELEGALNKVIAHSTLVGKEINIENTKEILKDLLRSNERVTTIEEIQKKVSERYNIKLSDLVSSRRVRSIARARQVGMYLAKQLTPKSLADIGKRFGKKDHTTVIHAIKTIEELTNSDRELQDEINLLTKILQN